MNDVAKLLEKNSSWTEHVIFSYLQHIEALQQYCDSLFSVKIPGPRTAFGDIIVEYKANTFNSGLHVRSRRINHCPYRTHELEGVVGAMLYILCTTAEERAGKRGRLSLSYTLVEKTE